MKKVIVIVGPTATGKSKLAVNLALKIGAEIISGDSIQVYKGLDIASGKIRQDEMKGVKHHLIDILEIGQDYSVADFQRQARKLISEIDVPIICGGTGLYVKAALTNYQFNGPSRDFNFEEKYQDYSDQDLYNVLVDLDKAQAEKIHPNNRKRVLRAIYMAEAGNKISENVLKDEYLYDAYIIYLNQERASLYEKIDKRIDKMFREGAVEENRKLYQNNQYVEGIGYREFKDYFDGNKTLDEVKEMIKLDSHHYAKRQLTWFNHQMESHFYDSSLPIDVLTDQVYQDVVKFLSGE